jgi:tetratricopeptide (TPR) repeat protein
MVNANAVIIPFGVPSEGRGLGLGLAALVHSSARCDGGPLAIAQLHGRRKDEPPDAAPSLVEAFVPPQTWRDIAGEAREGVEVVLTGVLEPPGDGDGKIQLLAFDARDGRTRAKVDATLDEASAGACLVSALEQIWLPLGGGIGTLEGVRNLSWEPLESVLRAERCALYDPQRGGPHDRLAAMAHLGRAIGDAPLARYPVERLAALGLEAASAPAPDAKLASAAARALARAIDDAPTHVELLEALAAMTLRLGQPREAERRLNTAIAMDPGRTRLYGLLSQALRAQGNLDGALAALEHGLATEDQDPSLLAERGMVHSAKGDLDAAAEAWRMALEREPVQPTAFASLAGLALRQGDAAAAQHLLDTALAAPRAHPDVLRRAVQLALATEQEGIARASRVSRLCAKLLEAAPSDAWASLTLARALVVLGDPTAARARLADVDRIAPVSSASAEAQLLRLTIADARADIELRSVLRAAGSADPRDLADVSARARRLATLHGAWSGWLAAAIAERRQQRWAAARSALGFALEMAPGATAVHLEMADVLLSLGNATGAVTHAERALALEGESPRALLVLARALSGMGREQDGRRVALRLLASHPALEEARALLAKLRPAEPPRAWSARLMDMLSRWRGERSGR